MSVVTLQLGQCGNQVGGEMLNQLTEDVLHAPFAYQKSVFSSFFRPPNTSRREREDIKNQGAPVPVARALMIDMEPKVIYQTANDAKATGRWCYDGRRQLWRQSGSANNWAFGYASHGPTAREDISNMVRKEVECCDNFGGFLVLQSLAGGTGSGLGTYTTELLRDEYPAGFMLNQVVWPHEHGEVTVQHFNAILTLAHLHHASDGILVFENDALTRICTQLLKLQHPSFRNMNALIAKQMTAVLLPSYRTAVRSCVSDTLAPPAQKTAEIKAAQDAHRGGGRVCRK